MDKHDEWTKGQKEEPMDEVSLELLRLYLAAKNTEDILELGKIELRKSSRLGSNEARRSI